MRAELDTIEEKKKAINRATAALRDFLHAWDRCSVAFSNIYFPDELLESPNYPFARSFDEHSLIPWATDVFNASRDMLDVLEKSEKLKRLENQRDSLKEKLDFAKFDAYEISKSCGMLSDRYDNAIAHVKDLEGQLTKAEQELKEMANTPLLEEEQKEM